MKDLIEYILVCLSVLSCAFILALCFALVFAEEKVVLDPAVPAFFVNLSPDEQMTLISLSMKHPRLGEQVTLYLEDEATRLLEKK